MLLSLQYLAKRGGSPAVLLEGIFDVQRSVRNPRRDHVYRFPIFTSTSTSTFNNRMVSGGVSCGAGYQDKSSYSGSGSTLVSPEWLVRHGDRVKILDATWYLPHMGKDPIDEFINLGRIPGSQYFDLDGVSRTDTDLPHMLPSADAFAAAADALGISENDTIVIYDRQGIFSSPRAWWTWKVFGHKGHVAVLDGGLPAWIEQGFPLVSDHIDRSEVQKVAFACQSASGDVTSTRYKAHLCEDLVKNVDDVLARSDCVIDARPAARFRGEAEEPRKGLAKGHMPGSKNIPWNAVLTEGAKKFKSPEEIDEVFKSVGIDSSKDDFSQIIASCGSGTTACILVLASEQLPEKKGSMAVYDGSWSEYGQTSYSYPVDTS
jgi:thiosulfate/3-mercaptopyruvate sulfurtransferase